MDWDDDHGWEPLDGRPALWQRLLAAALVVAVGLFLLGGLWQLVQLPPLDFLFRSRQLLDDPQIRERRAAVVQVNARGPLGESNGTGFNLSPGGLVITNRHVVDDARVVTVTFESGASFFAGQIFTHQDLDLAVVALNVDPGRTPPLPALSLETDAAPSPGEAVQVIGNPLGLARVVVEGTVAGMEYRPGSSRLLLVDAPVHPGHSGSPVLNRQGDVIGIVFAVAREGSRPGLAIPSIYIEEFLRGLEGRNENH